MNIRMALLKQFFGHFDIPKIFNNILFLYLVYCYLPLMLYFPCTTFGFQPISLSKGVTLPKIYVHIQKISYYENTYQ